MKLVQKIFGLSFVVLLLSLTSLFALELSVPQTDTATPQARTMYGVYFGMGENEHTMMFNYDGFGSIDIDPGAFNDYSLVADDMAFKVQYPFNKYCQEGFVMKTEQDGSALCELVGVDDVSALFTTTYQQRISGVCPAGQVATSVVGGDLVCVPFAGGTNACNPAVIIGWTNGHPGGNAPNTISFPINECNVAGVIGVVGQLDLSLYSCPSGKVLQGRNDADNSPICVSIARDFSCPTGESLQGFDANANPVCIASCIADTSGTCSEEPDKPTGTVVCGNNVVETGERCDDGNTINGDGCSSTCQDEPKGGDTSGTVVCGNNIVETGEQCDDGNTTSADGCSNICQNEPKGGDTSGPIPTCGPVVNGQTYPTTTNISSLVSQLCSTGANPTMVPASQSGPTYTRTCTQGSQTVAGCSATITDGGTGGSSGGAICGNNTVETGEQCDDGNTTNGDGCSITCEIETSSCSYGVISSGKLNGNMFMDINGDGFNDKLSFEEGRYLRVYLYNSSISTYGSNIMGNYSVNETGSPTGVQYMIVDINSDGYKDIFHFSQPQRDLYAHIFIPSNGVYTNNIMGTYGVTETGTPSGLINYDILDINKDCSYDIVHYSSYQRDVYVNLFAPANNTFGNNILFTPETMGGYQLMDINSDGYMDIRVPVTTSQGQVDRIFVPTSNTYQ